MDILNNCYMNTPEFHPQKENRPIKKKPKHNNSQPTVFIKNY